MNSSDCPTVWFRYVDNTFTLFRNKDTDIKFLHYLNNRIDNFQFTTEFEQNQEIPFLNVSIKRQNNNLSEHPLIAVSASVSRVFVKVCPECNLLPRACHLTAHSPFPRGVITYSMNNDVVTRNRKLKSELKQKNQTKPNRTKRSYHYITQKRCFHRFALSGTPE